MRSSADDSRGEGGARPTMAPSCSLDVILARDCARAVIFRRGPTRSVRLIGWDRTSDSFEPGQWLRGARVHVDRCDLSPDGQYLLAFIASYRPPFQTYTVLSRPPYFTALSLWPKGDTWGGGGRFRTQREIVLFHAAAKDGLGAPALAPGFRLPAAFSCVAYSKGMPLPVDDRWSWIDEAAQLRGKSGQGGVIMTSRGRLGRRKRSVVGLRAKGAEAELKGAFWADFDNNGDWLFSLKGGLYRLPAGDISAAVKTGALAEASQLLVDAADMRFEPVPAPYPSGYHEEVDLDEVDAYLPVLDRVTKEDRRRRAELRKAAKAAPSRR